MTEPVRVTEEEFRRLAEFLYRRTGMVFTESKRYFVERRIIERMAATASNTFSDYYVYLRSEIKGEVEQLINAFTVNETYFYREQQQLEALSAHILPEVIRGKGAGDRVRIWSIPCATGEEPFSVAMLLVLMVGAGVLLTAATFLLLTLVDPRTEAWATVAAGAVVTHDVADYALVMGTPARPAGSHGSMHAARPGAAAGSHGRGATIPHAIPQDCRARRHRLRRRSPPRWHPAGAASHRRESTSP